MSKNSTGTTLVYFLAGAAVGAAIALLYAPDDGKSIRDSIGSKKDDLLDQAARASSAVVKSARDKFSKVSDQVDSTLADVQSAVGPD